MRKETRQVLCQLNQSNRIEATQKPVTENSEVRKFTTDDNDSTRVESDMLRISKGHILEIAGGAESLDMS